MRIAFAVSAGMAAAVAAGFLVGASTPATDEVAIAEVQADEPLTPEPTPSPSQLTVGTTSPPLDQPVRPVSVLKPGEEPPQFVVMSFDGACEEPSGIFDRYLDLADDVDGSFTFNFGALCLLPRTDAKYTYQPPGRPAGSSDIGFARPEWVGDRIRTLSAAYLDGHEIATHYLGHFCGPSGVNSWSTADWTSEIDQFNQLLRDWPLHNPQVTDQEALPFDSSVITGGRTPCLEGTRSQLYPALVAAGHTYESSNAGTLVWPRKVPGFDLWDFPLQLIRVPDYGVSNLSMDYNFLVTQNGGNTQADPATCARIEESTYQSLMNAVRALHEGNRAPLFIGSHFNDWACGAYPNAFERFVRDANAELPDVQFVSNQDLVRWLEAQTPETIAQLQARPVQEH